MRSGPAREPTVRHRGQGAGPAPTVLRASGEEAETLLAYGVLDQLARSAGPAGKALAAVSAQPSRRSRSSPGPGCSSCSASWSRRDRCCSSSTTCTGPTSRPCAPSSSRCAGWWPTRCWLCSRCATTPSPSCRRACAGSSSGTTVPSCALPGLDEQRPAGAGEALGIASLPAPGRPAAARRDARQSRCTSARYSTSARPGVERRRGQPLPSPRSFRRLVGDRYAACGGRDPRLCSTPPPCWACGRRCRSRRPSAEVAEPVRAVDEAVARGLLVADTARHPWTLAFPHPLVRSALYDALGPARRTALHLAAARLVDDEVAVLHHRVAAAPGAGRRPRRRPRGVRPPCGGGPAVAERHATPGGVRPAVSGPRRGPPPPARRAELDAADRRRGERRRVHRGAARPAAPSPLRDSVLGTLAMARDDPDAAEEMYESAWKQCDADPLRTPMTRWPRRSRCRARCTTSAGSTAPAPSSGAGAPWSSPARRRRGPHRADVPGARPRVLWAHRRRLRGRRGSAARRATRTTPRSRWLQPRSARGVLRLVEDDLDGARADSPPSATRAYELGILNVAAFALGYLARAEYLAGAWDDAVGTPNARWR